MHADIVFDLVSHNAPASILSCRSQSAKWWCEYVGFLHSFQNRPHPSALPSFWIVLLIAKKNVNWIHKVGHFPVIKWWGRVIGHDTYQPTWIGTAAECCNLQCKVSTLDLPAVTNGPLCLHLPQCYEQWEREGAHHHSSNRIRYPFLWQRIFFL